MTTDAREARPPTVHVLWPNVYSETMVSYTMSEIVRGFMATGLPVQIHALARTRAPTRLRPRTVLPERGLRLTQRFVPDAMGAVLRLALRHVRPGDIAYLWLTDRPGVEDALHARGAWIAHEMVNCTLAHRRDLLRAAHAHAGIGRAPPMTDVEVEQEARSIRAADAVFCPNAHVVASVQAAGVQPHRCLATSYGWGADRIRAAAPRTEAGPVKFLFAGTGDVRKGLPVLLRAWAQANPQATLTLAGRLDAAVAAAHADVLARPEVRALGHVNDIDAVYAEHDVFVFPSWEEGGPQVTFEAMASGLVPVTTPMGSGGAFAAGDGLGQVIPPGGVDELAGVLRFCASNRPWLAAQRAAVVERVMPFEYTQVARQRADALLALYHADKGRVRAG